MNKMYLQSKWVRAYAIFIALFAFGAGIAAYMSPESMFSMIQVDWHAVNLISNGFAARNIAIGILATITIVLRNKYVYLALFLTRLSIDLQDLLNGLSAGSESINPWITIASLGLIFIIPLVLGTLQIIKEIKE